MLEAKPRRVVRRVGVGLSVLAAGLVLTGCVRIQVGLTVTGSDLVSGDVVAAALPNPTSQQGPKLTVPQEMVDQASAKPYSSGGYVGTELTFSNLSFAQLAQLISSGTDQKSHFQLNFQRSQDLVNFGGSADLTQLPSDAQVQLKVTFPGTILTTDGNNSDGTVSWSLPAGQVSTFTATTQYVNGEFIRPWSFWVKALGGAGLLIAALVTGLALLARRMNIRKEARQEAEV
ncbi:MAG TPA: hypothetical protein VHZ97_26175 [Pseudonocardiaceae bacterium]|nr:hypothetical protein [Pseudonocardiaceae bacterium]